MSHPHHQLRCFEAVIGVMDEAEFHPAVYNVPGPAIEWNRPLKKPVMSGKTVLGGGDVDGTMPTHIGEEMERAIMYGKPPEIVDGKAKYTRHATLQEVLVYVSQRK